MIFVGHEIIFVGHINPDILQCTIGQFRLSNHMLGVTAKGALNHDPGGCKPRTVMATPVEIRDSIKAIGPFPLETG